MYQLFLSQIAFTTRLFQIAIPVTSWLIITLPVWLSFWHPALVAYLLITFNIYWFYKAFRLAYDAIRSYISLIIYSKTDWLSQASLLPQFSQTYHVIIIPQFREPIHILRRTLSNLTKQNFPLNQIIIVLACEAKDEHADVVSKLLKEEFSPSFGKFIVTKHPLTPLEVAGKSSNMAYAAKELVKILTKERWDMSQITVTSCDADALLHPQYLSCLTYHFLTDPEREYHLYQGAILFYANIWRIPLPNRFLNTLNSIWNLAVLSQPRRLINFSTYSLPLNTVINAGYWGVDVIPEDYHLFFTIYFKYGSHVSVRPLFLPVLVDAAESHGFFRTMANQYEQTKRWAWGVSDLPFVIRNMLIHREIPFNDRLRRTVNILEHHILWPANWFLLTIGSALPPLVNPNFARTVLGHNISQIASSILTLSTVFLLVVFIIDWRIKPPRPKEVASWNIPFLYLQWFTLPVIAFFLSALPGLDAHTRMMIGKKLEYRVTEKV